MAFGAANSGSVTAPASRSRFAWSYRGGPGAVPVSTALFAVGFSGRTAFEIIVFALILGRIRVFIRFLGVADLRAGQRPEALLVVCQPVR